MLASVSETFNSQVILLLFIDSNEINSSNQKWKNINVWIIQKFECFSLKI